MPCYNPLEAYRLTDGGITFKPDGEDIHGAVLRLPCGNCIGCRLERSRQWAVRCVHEASLYEDNMFITLTYSPENLPENGTLVKSHFQSFMKRLRKFAKVRYFHCGEYGDDLARPHYHALIFGYEFPDKKTARQGKSGEPQWSSEILNKTWGLGDCLIGKLNFESAAYVARYCTKKINGPQAKTHYKGKQPEYVTMSLKPGIGARWADKFMHDTYKDDTVIMRGKEAKPPRYYDKRFAMLDPAQFQTIQFDREESGMFKPQRTRAELAVSNEVKTRNSNIFSRNL